MILPIVAFAGIALQAQEPALWLRPDGHITMDGKEVKAQISPGTRILKSSGPWVFDFSGPKSGILFGNPKSLEITNSITVSTWIFARSYVNDGPGAQILFRGDDRCGVDPYYFAIHGDGTIHFAIENGAGGGISVGAELPLKQWVHIMANYDADAGRLTMYKDGEMVAFTTTSIKPFGALDNGWTPGVSVGNVQNDKGPHNQPFNGQLADLRLYRGVLNPTDIGFQPGSWFEPPRR